ncbi:permease-like cell division protein FtsX [Plantactinospora sp. CA-290183]|uniref:permease-like cell division protein FtsX n=1 Tax=Plantactinospora sp. CA-290183 TaxID=3240006 RepID=UPI003D8A4043
MSDLPPRSPTPAVAPPTVPPPTVPPPTVPPPAGAGRPGRWPSWIVPVAVAVAVVAMLVGAATATGILVAQRVWQAGDRYVVTVFLADDVTAEQKRAVESALSARYPADRVRAEDPERTWQRLREEYADEPNLVPDAEPGNRPASLRVETTAKVFDCARVTPVTRMPGVRLVTVVRPATEDHPNLLFLACG